MLPSLMVKFKQYSAELISVVLDGIVHPDNADLEDRPCEETMKRWRYWFMANELRIDGMLKSVSCRDLGVDEALLRSGISLLERLRKTSERWLEIIHSFIYNSGGFLAPV